MCSPARVDESQLNLLDVAALPECIAKVEAVGKARTTLTRDRVSVDLRGFGPRLRERAAQRGMAPAALLRKVAMALLDDEHGLADEGGVARESTPVRGGAKVKVTLRLPAVHAAMLASRARAATVAQGDYVRGMLDGAAPPPLPPDHGASVRVLLASTDRLAVLTVDLNAFTRMLARVPASQLEPYRASLRSLVDDVRKHLALSAALMAELRPARKARR